MHQKLLQNVLLVGFLLITSGFVLSGCIDEPTIPPIATMTTNVRFINATLDGVAIDVYIIDKTKQDKVVAGKPFKQSSNYLTINSGDLILWVTVAGASTDTLIYQKITLASLTQQSIVVFDKATKNANTAFTPASFIQTIERYTYSDETKNLKDSTAVKLIHVCKGVAPVILVRDNIAAPRDTIAGASTDSVAFIVGPTFDKDGNLTSETNGVPYGWPSRYSTYPKMFLLGGTYKFYPFKATGGEIFPVEPFYRQVTVDKGKRYTFVLLKSATTDPEIVVFNDDI